MNLNLPDIVRGMKERKQIMSNNKMPVWKKILGTVIIPSIAFLVCAIICAAHGKMLFETSGNWLAFFRAACSVMLTTFALSINLNSGRFDFSIGAVSLLSSVISSELAIQFNLSAYAMLALAIAIGLVLGLLSGGVYILTNLPPIIVSLGIALAYEGISFAITGGYGVSFVTNTKLVQFQNVPKLLIITIVALAFMIVVFDHTSFGYNYKALLSGQKVAVNTGIRERGNTLGCYGICGALMGIVGFLSATNTGTIQMSLNFGSIGVMFTAFFPMFVGGFIGRFSNDKLGYLLGAVTSAFVSLTYARLDVDSSIQQIITALILVGFLIYLNNENKIIELRMLKQASKQKTQEK